MVSLAGPAAAETSPLSLHDALPISLPVLVSVTTIVTGSPVLTAVGALFRVSEVEVVTPRAEPLWLSPSAGAALPNSSVPWPRADQALAPAAAVKVQVKSCETVAARVTLAGLKDEQAPPPVTFTFVNVPLPVLVSVTTIVTGSPVLTAVGALFRASVVDTVMALTLPWACSPADGAGLPKESVP